MPIQISITLEILKENEMTKEEAIEMFKSEWWKNKTPKEIVEFQLYEDRICIPFGDFHEAIEKVLGRSVWTHEFADIKCLQEEFEGKRTFEGPIESAKRIMPNKPIITIINNKGEK